MGIILIDGREPRDDVSALVALTEREVAWLGVVLKEMREKCEEIHATKWQGEPLSLAKDIEGRLAIALFGLTGE